MRYLYALYAMLSFLLLFLALFPLFLLFGLMGFKKGIWYIIHVWSILWLAMIGMRTQIINENNRPFTSHNGYILLANHQSYMDVPLIFRAIPIMTRTLAKAELAKVPLFGYLYRQMTVLVDRSNPVSKRKSIMDLKKLIRNGESVFIFPEGTFNETSKTMIPFYDGAFKIALESQSNILPILFLDSADRFSYKSIWHWSPGKNRVIILPEIDVSQYDVTDIKQLKKDVFNIMSRAMHRYKPHLELAIAQ